LLKRWKIKAKEIEKDELFITKDFAKSKKNYEPGLEHQLTA